MREKPAGVSPTGWIVACIRRKLKAAQRREEEDLRPTTRARPYGNWAHMVH